MHERSKCASFITDIPLSGKRVRSPPQANLTASPPYALIKSDSQKAVSTAGKGVSDMPHKEIDILATIGPHSDDKETIRSLIKAGATFFRLNFSHGTPDTHRKTADLIRKIDAEESTHTHILADLQGPKIRIGTFENDEITLHKDMVMRFDLDPAPGDETRVHLPHPKVIDALEVGSHILLDDGNVYMEIVDKGADFVDAKVLNGEKLSNRKGMNIPDVYLPMPALTSKDRNDLQTALDIGVDYIALSFVQRGADVTEAKTLINGRARLISKIEKPAALENFPDILTLSDGIMVARGDLGVEIPPEHVPGVQREIIRQSNQADKFVVVATHMLDSMVDHPRPTRAEANDVSAAIVQGADAVMLSGETAVGHNPAEAVRMMRRICESTRAELDNPAQFLHTVFQHAATAGNSTQGQRPNQRSSQPNAANDDRKQPDTDGDTPKTGTDNPAP